MIQIVPKKIRSKKEKERKNVYLYSKILST
jgi:hypothetical protein